MENTGQGGYANGSANGGSPGGKVPPMAELAVESCRVTLVCRPLHHAAKAAWPPVAQLARHPPSPLARRHTPQVPCGEHPPRAATGAQARVAGDAARHARAGARRGGRDRHAGHAPAGLLLARRLAERPVHPGLATGGRWFAVAVEPRARPHTRPTRHLCVCISVSTVGYVVCDRMARVDCLCLTVAARSAAKRNFRHLSRLAGGPGRPGHHLVQPRQSGGRGFGHGQPRRGDVRPTAADRLSGAGWPAIRALFSA